jgi:hypothetical protein
MELLSIAKRRKYFMPMIIIILVALGFIAYKATARQSPEYIENVNQAKRTIALGWPIKHLATVEGNQENTLELRKKLSDYYGNQEQELTKQQRFITIALDKDVNRDDLPGVYTKYYVDDNTAIVGFNVSGFIFDDVRIEQDKATVTGKVEYLIKRRMLSQEYGTLASNTYEWQLVKTGGKWLIVKETVLLEDQK